MRDQNKTNKQLKQKYGKLAESMVAYYDHLDLRRIDDLDDEAFAFIMRPVSGVNMLDLNETGITNKAIQLLAGMEYVKELRVKGCRIDDGCIQDLDKITGLEFLHVKDTAVTIDGLLQLTSLTGLKTVLFSSENVDAIKEKMLLIKAMHPACEFFIDGKTYYFDNIERLIYATRSRALQYSMKIRNGKDDEWSSWIIKPTDGYYETEKQGPFSVDEIEWIAINPVEERTVGKLIPVKMIDHTEEIVKLLEELTIPYMIVEEIIRIYIVKNHFS